MPRATFSGSMCFASTRTACTSSFSDLAHLCNDTDATETSGAPTTCGSEADFFSPILTLGHAHADCDATGDLVFETGLPKDRSHIMLNLIEQACLVLTLISSAKDKSRKTVIKEGTI